MCDSCLTPHSLEQWGGLLWTQPATVVNSTVSATVSGSPRRSCAIAIATHQAVISSSRDLT
ncbi:hypothetical protein, partial [Nostoc sp.]|uniref:hypothetical protein n=1 Tax=Nostoc sp. TaxID=1180 RepID=UPI002FFBC145